MKLWVSDLIWDCTSKGVTDWDRVLEELICSHGYKDYIAQVSIEEWKCTFAQTG
jgi:hypothetical protein